MENSIIDNFLSIMWKSLPDGNADSRAMEEGKGKELEHADSSEVDQQATATLQ